MSPKNILSSLFAVLFLCACSTTPEYDLVIRDGLIYDGSGSVPFAGDLAIIGDRIVQIGAFEGSGLKEISANGMAIAPGFINMLSWANESLIEDGRSISDIRQGVTLEIMGEGESMGPINKSVEEYILSSQADIKFDIEWQSLDDYLQFMVNRGVSPNIASFVGAATLRVHEIGFDDRKATPEEMDNMKVLLDKAMQDGALGLGSSLIYAPAFYASTEELVELTKVVAKYDGMYISHMRSEGNNIMQALDELITIARKTGVSAEIYHLKMAGAQNWDKYQVVIDKIESARKEGLNITADMYLYTAAATGLDASMPPWVQEGGQKKWEERLKQPEIREKVISEMKQDSNDWENLYFGAGPEGIILLGFKTEKLKPYTGKTLAEVALIRGTSPEETAMDLVIEDGYRVSTGYFLMSEENVIKQIALPWMSFGSDAESIEPAGVFLKANPHPRAYGNFARLLGKYVRDEKVISLSEAIRKLTSQPAENLKIKKRGRLKKGYYADVVIFEPDNIKDHATFKDPHQLSTGMSHVFVNGIQVLSSGQHTGATPGRIVRGPGYKESN